MELGNRLELLKQKYDAKTNAGVRGARKALMLEQNPNIVEEKGDNWIEYLYNTPAKGELDLYKKQLEEALEDAKQTSVMEVETDDSFIPPQGGVFNPLTGEFDSEETRPVPDKKDIGKEIFDPSKGGFAGFISDEEKQSSIRFLQQEINEISQLIQM